MRAWGRVETISGGMHLVNDGPRTQDAELQAALCGTWDTLQAFLEEETKTAGRKKSVWDEWRTGKGRAGGVSGWNLLAKWNRWLGFEEVQTKKQRSGARGLETRWDGSKWVGSDGNQGRSLQWWEEGAEQDTQHRMLFWKPKREAVVLNFFIPLLYRLTQPGWKNSLSYHAIWAYPEGQSSEIHHISVSWASDLELCHTVLPCDGLLSPNHSEY